MMMAIQLDRSGRCAEMHPEQGGRSCGVRHVQKGSLDDLDRIVSLV
jgi:hypothetical protein